MELNDIGAATAVDGRIAATDLDQVVAGAAVNPVFAATSVDDRARRGGIDGVTVRARCNFRLTAAAHDEVVTGPADNHIGTSTPDQRIAARAALDVDACPAAAHDHVSPPPPSAMVTPSCAMLIVIPWLPVMMTVSTPPFP